MPNIPNLWFRGFNFGAGHFSKDVWINQVIRSSVSSVSIFGGALVGKCPKSKSTVSRIYIWRAAERKVPIEMILIQIENIHYILLFWYCMTIYLRVSSSERCKVSNIAQDLRAHRCHRGVRSAAGEIRRGATECRGPLFFLKPTSTVGKSVDSYTENEPRCRKLNEHQIFFHMK